MHQSAARAKEERRAVLQLKRLRHNLGQADVQLSAQASAGRVRAAVVALHAARPGTRQSLNAVREVRRLLCQGACVFCGLCVA